MSGDYPPRRFEFGLPAVVQQPFTHAGKSYKPGDVFPYEQLGLAKWQMQGFWLASLVDFKQPDLASSKKQGKQPQAR
jgi:hypothetical protein